MIINKYKSRLDQLGQYVQYIDDLADNHYVVYGADSYDIIYDDFFKNDVYSHIKNCFNSLVENDRNKICEPDKESISAAAVIKDRHNDAIVGMMYTINYDKKHYVQVAIIPEYRGKKLVPLLFKSIVNTLCNSILDFEQQLNEIHWVTTEENVKSNRLAKCFGLDLYSSEEKPCYNK